MSGTAHPPTHEQSGIPCMICGTPLDFSLRYTRRAGKPYIQLICLKDPRHFQAFSHHAAYVRGVMERLDGHPIEDEPS